MPLPGVEVLVRSVDVQEARVVVGGAVTGWEIDESGLDARLVDTRDKQRVSEPILCVALKKLRAPHLGVALVAPACPPLRWDRLTMRPQHLRICVRH